MTNFAINLIRDNDIRRGIIVADAYALNAHRMQPHFARLGELKAEFVDETVIEKFEV